MAKYPPPWRPGSQMDAPPPADGMRRFWFLFCTHFFKIILLNLLYLLFCVPVFTIPAATAGMTNVLMKLWREGNCFLWADFWSEFKTEFPSRMFLWFAMQLVPMAFWFLPAFLGAKTVAFWLSLIAEAFILLIDAYWFPLVTTMDVSSAVSLKNACLLLPIAFKNSLAMLAVIALFYGVCYLLLPFTLPVILLFSFSCERLILCLKVQPVMEQWLVQKEE